MTPMHNSTLQNHMHGNGRKAHQVEVVGNARNLRAVHDVQDARGRPMKFHAPWNPMQGDGPMSHQVEVVGDALDLRAVHDVQNADRLLEGEVWQELGGEQEALWCAGLASRLHQQPEDLPLIHAVHALINLVHYSEWGHCHILYAWMYS